MHFLLKKIISFKDTTDAQQKHVEKVSFPKQQFEIYLGYCLWKNKMCAAVFRIRIHMFLGLPDPDPLVRGMDPDPSIIMQK